LSQDISEWPALLRTTLFVPEGICPVRARDIALPPLDLPEVVMPRMLRPKLAMLNKFITTAPRLATFMGRLTQSVGAAGTTCLVGLANASFATVFGWKASAVFCAPVVEELARFTHDRGLPYFTTQMIVQEFIAYPHIVARIPPTLLHLTNYCLLAAFGLPALPAAIILHAVYNALVICVSEAAGSVKFTQTATLMNAKNQADSYLDQLSSVPSGLSEAGKEWLKVAIDPFHDSDTYVTGYPDVDIAPSVVQVVKKTITIGAPTGTVANWDCHIAQSPVPSDSGSTWSKYGIVGGNILAAVPSATIAPFAGVSAIGGAPGAALDFSQATVASQVGNVQLDDSYLRGASRVIAQGFEVTNTTAVLNMQGQVIAYRLAEPAGTPSNFQCASLTASLGSFAARQLTVPPTSAANAMLTAGSRQWAASEGGYVVSALSSLDIPAEGELFIQPMLLVDESGTTGDTFVAMPTLTTEGGGVVLTPPLSYTAPFHVSGLYFTGLSLTTTLNLTTVWYVERFPDYEETDLAVLAKPSPAYDPFALKLYSRALCSLPPGVMVKENGLGDWFASTVGKIAEYAAPIVKMLPIPGAQYISGAISAGGSIARSMSASRGVPNQVSPVGLTTQLAQPPGMTDPRQAQVFEDAYRLSYYNPEIRRRSRRKRRQHRR